jgi:ABC-type multidrug transport system fused ATPase/permease subunit
MPFEKLKENAEEVQENAKAFIESNIAYYRLLGFKIAIKSTTMLLKIFLITICVVMVLLFFSIAGALAIGSSLNSNSLGFLIVGGIYLVLGLVIYLIKNKIVEKPIIDIFSDIFFDD